MSARTLLLLSPPGQVVGALCMTDYNGQSLSEAGSSDKGLCKSLQLHISYPQHHVSGHFSS